LNRIAPQNAELRLAEAKKIPQQPISKTTGEPVVHPDHPLSLNVAVVLHHPGVSEEMTMIQVHADSLPVVKNPQELMTMTGEEEELTIMERQPELNELDLSVHRLNQQGLVMMKTTGELQLQATQPPHGLARQAPLAHQVEQLHQPWPAAGSILQARLPQLRGQLPQPPRLLQ